MITRGKFNERRKYPRLESNIPLKLCREDGDIVTETANISRSGAYCKVNQFIEPMTKLMIHLLIPIKKDEKIVTKKVSCEGVVVRTEQAKDNETYNVAIFFNSISAKDIDIIEDYVSFYLKDRG